MSKPKISTPYLHDVFYPENLNQTVKNLCSAVERLEYAGKEVNAIACQGISGVLVAPIVAHKLFKHLIVVRKDLNTHSHEMVEGLQGIGEGRFNYVIIDDCVETGHTVANVLTQIEGFTNGAGNCISIFLYADDRDGDELMEEVKACDSDSRRIEETGNYNVIERLAGGARAFESVWEIPIAKRE